MRSARRRSRELAMQGLYQWLLSGASPAEIETQLQGTPGFDKADRPHLDTLLRGVVRDAAQLDGLLQPCLDRPLAELSPVERAVLLVGAYELVNHIEIPYRVVINEAVELAKTFGGSDGYKYVNGVLDKLSATVRETEVRHAQPSSRS